MKRIAVYAILTGAGCLFHPQILANPLPAALQAPLPAATLSGQATLTFWGFKVYKASLWVTAGFVSEAYSESAFALELAYQRELKGADIAKRSITEMRRQGPIEAEREARWETGMRELFPDVKPGDKLTGVNQPDKGALFLSNGRVLGEISDPQFARLFFGIWLAPQTSEPQLRRDLLARAASRSPEAGTP